MKQLISTKIGEEKFLGRPVRKSDVYHNIILRAKAEIKKMSLKEVESILLPWTSQEGWNVRTGDFFALYSQDPNSFFLLSINQIPIASVLVTRLNQKAIFIGSYFVNPLYRGKGWGKYLWDNVLANVEASILGLNSVAAQIKNYQREGFSCEGEQILRARIQKGLPLKEKGLDENELGSISIKQITDTCIDQLIEYDRSVLSFDRAAFLRALLKINDTIALAAWEGGKLQGYGIMRKCSQEGFKIAPLYAENETAYRKLLLAFCENQDSNTSTYMDIVESKLGLLNTEEIIFSVVPMCRGSLRKNIRIQSVYGVCSMEAFPV